MAQNTKKTATDTPSRREEILAVATKVFAERGIKQATVRDIGEAAGILSGSLYYHFKSKDQIVLELLLPSVERGLAASTKILEQHSGLAALEALIRNSVSSTARNPERAIIFRNEAQRFGEMPLLVPVATIRAQIIEIWIEAIRQGIESGEIRPTIDAEVVARAINDGTLGTSRWFANDRQTDPEAVVDALIDFYVSGLKQH